MNRLTLLNNVVVRAKVELAIEHAIKSNEKEWKENLESLLKKLK